jgi:hypothetical protein
MPTPAAWLSNWPQWPSMAPVGRGFAGGVLAEDGVDGAGGKEAGEQRAEGSAGAVNAKGVERVVVAEEAFDHEDHEEADDAGDEADGQRAHGLDKAGGLGDGDQAGDRAGDGAQGGGLAVVNPLGDDQPMAAAAAAKWVLTKALVASGRRPARCRR